MLYKSEKLTQNEVTAQESFAAGLAILQRKTKKPIIIALIGLVGSGKSSVAIELSGGIGATVIDGDKIRVELSKQREQYERIRVIAMNVAMGIVERGGNVILDSDFIVQKKRAGLREKARKAGVEVVFIRAYCDFDVAIERIRKNKPNQFYANASSMSKSEYSGKDVKIRELLRRTPNHYRWIKEGGGKWILKKLQFSIFAEIDTTDEVVWKNKMKRLNSRILEI